MISKTIYLVATEAQFRAILISEYDELYCHCITTDLSAPCDCTCYEHFFLCILVFHIPYSIDMDFVTYAIISWLSSLK